MTTKETSVTDQQRMEQRAATVLQEAIWPAIRDYPDDSSWTWSEVANLVVTKAVDALVISYLLDSGNELLIRELERLEGVADSATARINAALQALEAADRPWSDQVASQVRSILRGEA